MKIQEISLLDTPEVISADLRDGKLVFSVTFDHSDSQILNHFRVLMEALDIHAERESERAGVWRRSGLKGQTMHAFAKAERAFAAAMRGEVPHRDNYIDLINYSAFAVRLMREADEVGGFNLLNGGWPWNG